MKRFSIMILILSAAVMALPGMGNARPQPPEGLTDIFSSLGELEETFENNAWTEAEEGLAEVEEQFEKLVPVLVPVAGKSIGDDFSFIAKAMKKSLRQKDEEKATKNFIAMQRLIFDVMDGFDYRIHPMILIMDRYTQEALDAAEEKDFKEVTAEMLEVRAFLKKGLRYYADNSQVSRQMNVMDTLAQNAGEAAEKKDQETAEKELKKLSVIIKDLIFSMN